MRIGTDVSIGTCRAEGYMVMDYPVHAFRRDPQNTECRFTRSIPEWARKVTDPIIEIDTELNYKDLYEMYKERKSGIDSFIGGEHEWLKTPEPYDLLQLASDLDNYCNALYTGYEPVRG
jgi:hypothetical protein